MCALGMNQACEGTERISAALQRSEVFPNERQPWRRPLAYYYLHAQLTAPWEAHSLLAEAPAASTTGLSLIRTSAVSIKCCRGHKLSVDGCQCADAAVMF